MVVIPAGAGMLNGGAAVGAGIGAAIGAAIGAGIGAGIGGAACAGAVWLIGTVGMAGIRGPPAPRTLRPPSS